MRPKIFTLRNALLLLVAVGVFSGMAYWLSVGAPLPGAGVPSTAGKIVFISDRGGKSDLWMMDAATGENAVALTKDAAADRQPTLNAVGSEVAFISEGRSGGVTPQVYTVDAKPDAKILPLTNTSATKEQPRYGPKGRVYYLASGKLSATDPANRETDQVFPEADEVRALAGNENTPGILSTGGIASAAVSPDGNRIAAVIKTERGQALLLITPGQHAGQGTLLGVGSRIFCQFLADGRLVVSFEDGSPLAQAQIIYNKELIEGGGVVAAQPLNDLELPLGSFAIALFDTEGVASGALPLPFGPDIIAVSPDGSRIAVGVSKPASGNTKKPAFVGLAVLPLGENVAQGAGRLSSEPVDSITWSSDGSRIAYGSAGDIFSVPVDGSAPPVNLTKGQGVSSSPVWSPAKSRK
ncbi:MAG: PD40 domain-containing protein [Cytophagales bacterium]|nr:PD40 domain-containing protein [Armatimonadota bacterium]